MFQATIEAGFSRRLVAEVFCAHATKSSTRLVVVPRRAQHHEVLVGGGGVFFILSEDLRVQARAAEGGQDERLVDIGLRQLHA